MNKKKWGKKGRMQISGLLSMAVAALLLSSLALVIDVPSRGSMSAVAEPAKTTQDETQDETDPKPVAVTDIELGDYETRMLTGKTQELSATVLPVDATEQTVVFSSSDTRVVTVSSKGQLKAVGAGVAVISMRAGEVTKEIVIEVRVATTAIKTNFRFLVLTPGETFALKVSVAPADAPQSLSYKALNKDVAGVTEAGVIQAREAGATSIIVSNGDMSAAVVVLVNKRTAISTGGTDGVDPSVAPQDSEGKTSSLEAVVIERIESGESMIRAKQYDVPLVTTGILKALYDNRSTLVLESSSYVLTVVGEKIKNERNELSTDISFRESADGIEFALNRGNNLPGEIEVELTERILNREFLYLFNADKDMYQELNSKTGATLKLDEPGEYRLADERLDRLTVNPLWAGIAIGIIFVGVVAFVIVKRRYWFW
jgi:uncharacterized protein YjdB